MSRLVLITMARFAPSAPSLVAPLRLAIGLASAYKRQPVKILLCDEGVLHGARDRNPDWLDRYITSATAHGVEMYADQGSLDTFGLGGEQLHPFVKAKPTEEFWQLRSSSALNLSF
jgi:predicted peroxiredoxin